MLIKFCCRCENQIGEDENVAELEGVTYHVACLIADLLEQIIELKRRLGEE